MATIKQKKAVKAIVENRGNISKAMILAGYDPTSAKNPKNLTESKGYKELMDEVLPDKFLIKKHKELLSVPLKITLKKTGDVIECLDTFAISKGLDMAYKIKGSYAPEKSQNVNLDIDVKIDADIEKLSEQFEAKLRKKYEAGRRITPNMDRNKTDKK